MKKNGLRFSIALLAASTSACVSVPTGTYTLGQQGSADETSLIRPAKKEERQYKPSVAARMFSVPAGTAQLLHIWPASNLSTGTSLQKFESVRVAPGAYLVKVLCNVGGFAVYYDLPIETHAGKDQLIECTGATAHRANITAREIDAPR